MERLPSAATLAANSREEQTLATAVSTPLRQGDKVVPFTHPLTREYQPGYLDPGSLHPDAVLPCERCGRDVTAGAIIYKFPKGSGFRGQIWHADHFRLAEANVLAVTA